MIFASVPVIQPPEQMNDTRSLWNGCGPELLLVDNTPDHAWEHDAAAHGWTYLTFGKNLGVSASWNAARAAFLDQTQREHDLLFLFSSSVRFDDGLPRVLDQLSYAANWKGCQTQVGPHALAYSRAVLEQVGTWDENMMSYVSDTDYFYRMIVEGILVANPDPMPQIEINCPTPEDGRALHRTNMVSNTAACIEYFAHKWGGPASLEQWRTPFNSGLPSSWWSPHVRPGLEQVPLGETQYR